MGNKTIVWILISCMSAMLCVTCPAENGELVFAQTQEPGYGQPAEKHPSPSSDEQQESRQQKQQTSNQLPRQDNYYGTFHEGIVMETDPQTGDRIIQVSPPPKKEKKADQNNTYVITPEIKINPQ